MFGHDHNEHDENVQGGQAPMPVEPNDDGTLGVPAPDDDNTTPSVSLPSANDSVATTPAPMPILSNATPQASPTPDDLLNIKQEALQQLKPLVGHLNQSPEEKFRTTMMMIQAADDQSLLSDAYEAAKAISDEKARAQALLDVVNEINYFTTQKD